MICEYASKHYGVPADIGRKVTVDGEPGVIAEDRGAYIGVLFDKDKPGDITPCHPTWKVEYGEIGKVRPMTAAQRRYREYMDADWFGGTFGEWIHYHHTPKDHAVKGLDKDGNQVTYCGRRVGWAPGLIYHTRISRFLIDTDCAICRRGLERDRALSKESA